MGEVERTQQSFSSDLQESQIQEVPQIYKLIEENAHPQAILGEIYKNSSEPGNLYLGFKNLIERGLEGVAAIEYIAQKDSSHLGDVAKKILDEKGMTAEKLEGIVGMPERFQKTVKRENGPLEDNSAYVQEICDYMKAKGYKSEIPLDGREGIGFYKFMVDINPVPPQITGAIENESLTISHTFGVAEPAYIELNGPEEILRLRNKDNPQMLLLGSLGMYSAREFSGFVKKVNQNATPNVVDAYAEEYIQSYEGERDMQFKQADVLNLPYEDGSIDQAYTNYLLHAFIHDNEIQINRDLIDRFFKENYRVLADNGSLVMLEMPYGLNISEGYSDEHIKELVSLALQNGFSIAKRNTTNLPEFPVRHDIVDFNTGENGAEIDKYGFGKYGDKLTSTTNSSYMGFRFVKTEK